MDYLQQRAQELIQAAAKEPPAERFRRRVQSGQITAEGRFKAPWPPQEAS